MSHAVLTERFAAGSPAGAAQQGWQWGQQQAAASPQWCVVPRAELKFAKCEGGFRITCKCEDEVAAHTLQNLCNALANGGCSCSCTFNGIQCCQCNFATAHCHCEHTKDGVKITCTSGDKQSCDMLQACCDCLHHCCEAGCACYVCFNNTPVCCSTC